MALRSVGVRLVAEVGTYITNIRNAAKTTGGFTAELDKAARAGKLDAVADQAGRMGLALAAGFLLVERAAARFEKQMSAVSAATHASAGDMQKLSAAALQAGKDTKFSATEAGQGIEELAKAGVSTADILGGGLSGALNLAAAGELGVGEAAETAASAMTQFKLTGKDMTHVADLLAAGAGKAQGSVHDMAQALNQGGLVASQMGLSIEETTGTLAAFASAGLLGSDSGTSFKTMLLRLASPTDVAKAKMQELGISAFDAQGNFVGMAKFAGILQDALSGLSQEQRLAAMNVIFGTDAIRASSIVYAQGKQGIQGWIDKTNASGYAAETAAIKTDNLMGDIERLTGSLETLAIQSGSGANSGLRILAQAVDSLLDAFGNMPSFLQSGIVILVGVSGAALLAFAALIKVRASATKAMAELRAMGPAGVRAAEGLTKVGRYARFAAGALVALELASAALESLNSNTVDAERLTKSLEELGKTGKNTGELTRLFGDNLSGWADAVYDTSSGFSEFGRTAESLIPGLKGLSELTWGYSFTQSAEQVKAADEALTELVRNGKLNEARAAFTRLLQASGVSYEELERLLPGYIEAIREAEKSTSGAAGAQDAAASKAKLLAGGMYSAELAGRKLIDVFNELNGRAIDFAEAQIKVEGGLDRITESFKENGKTLDINTKAGRENKQAILDVIQASADAAQKKYDESGSIKDATHVYDDYIGRLKETLRKQGLSKTAINDIIAAYASMPTLVVTTVTANTLPAQIKLAAIEAKVLALKDRTIRISAQVYWTSKGLHVPGGTHLERWGGITEHAQTGLLRDAEIATPRSPARYAWAEPATGGEAFVPRRGNTGRSLGILQHAAGWYGHALVPTGGRAGGGGAGGVQTIVHQHQHTVTLSGKEMISGFRREVALSGGSAQRSLGSKKSG